jgi:uroporphyrinogen decarboxylase
VRADLRRHRGRTPREVELDFAHGWEDMCFNHGPIISPEMFERWLVPRYARIAELLKARHDVDVVIVDCDGDIGQLVPLWLDGGVNCMFPLEIAAGTDPFDLRRRYGERVILKGGVDKRALIAGADAIDAEIARLEPLVAEGGFIPHVDHRVPPDVSYADYLYYLRRKRDTFGMPHPKPATEPPS